MLDKLALRNAKRSMKDYLVYIITMTIIASLMMAFNSMLFSKDIVALYSIIGIMAAMMGLASVFILFIVSWLIRYMVRFMMEKRSKEFGTYLILGMNKKEITHVFMKENLIMGTAAFVLGILPGMFLQQVLTTIFYSIFEKGYNIQLDFSIFSFLLSLALYYIMFFFALLKMKRKMKKLSIREFMNMEKQNEEVEQKSITLKIVLFTLSIGYLIVFFYKLYSLQINMSNFFILIPLLILCLYFLYCGVSAYVTNQIVKKKKCIYKRDSLFLKRQFSSKLKTMQFTMGTVTVLFITALLGTTIAMMFNDYQGKQLNGDLPFDLIIFSDDPTDSFEQQKEAVKSKLTITNDLVYRIYENGTDTVNQIMYSTLPYFKKGGISSEKNTDASNTYFDYDTYMKLSDYNYLRSMLGYEEITLETSQYYIHMEERLTTYLDTAFDKVELPMDNGENLSFGGYATESFSQCGMNGADYIIVVPDDIVEQMTPFYSLYAASTEGNAPESLYDDLIAMKSYRNNEGDTITRITWGYGSQQIITCMDFVLIRETMTAEMKFVMTAVSFPCIYIALVFLCVALTVLAVQQVSDSAKYKFRYSVLSKLGLRNCEIDRLVLKQLALYYLCPYVITVLISAGIAMFLGDKFVFYTGIDTQSFWYYGTALVTFSMIYLMYFVVTFVEFRRNIAN